MPPEGGVDKVTCSPFSWASSLTMARARATRLRMLRLSSKGSSFYTPLKPEFNSKYKGGALQYREPKEARKTPARHSHAHPL